MSKVNAVRNLLQVEQSCIGSGRRCAGPYCAMVNQFQNRGPAQGAAQQYAKEVAARGMPAAGDNMISRVATFGRMLVMMRMRVVV